jgi:hypothetical protein
MGIFAAMQEGDRRATWPVDLSKEKPSRPEVSVLR